MWSSPSRSSTPDGRLRCRMVRSGDSARRPHVRFHQWLSRRGELHRDGRVHARAVAERRCRLGGVLEFRGGVRVRNRDREDGGERTDRPQRCRFASGWTKTLIFIVVAPVMGFALALLLTVALSWILRRSLPRRVDKTFRVLQLVSAAAYSLGHGTNDAQKTMGIIVALLVTSQALFVNFPIQAFHLTDANHIPVWVILAAHAAIGLGTMAGGWRIVKTMGQRITKLTPFGGFCAETAGAITLFVSSHYGIPVSTTHTITGAITGVGAANRISAVRWGVAQRIVWAWMLTIPAAAGIGGLTYLLLRAIV